MNNNYNIQINRIWFKLLEILTVVLFSQNAYGAIENINDIHFTYDWNLSQSVHDYYEASAYKCYATTVYIVPTFEIELGTKTWTYRVTEIDDNFCNKTGYLDGGFVKNPYGGLVIPEYVKKIGSCAFAGCSKLDQINFRSNELEYIGDKAFNGCSGIKSMNISSCRSLKTIGSEAFANCSNLSYVYIPESVQNIGVAAFYQCTGLTHVSLPNTLETIENSTFYECENLVSLILPASLKTIESWAFGYSGISGNLGLPSGLKKIYNNAFEFCKNLQGPLNFPDSVISIESGAFRGCSNISGSLTFGKSIEKIQGDAFLNVGDINTVIIKAQVPPRGTKFPDIIYKNAVLYVPIGTLSDYANAPLWKDFAVIKEEEYQAPEKFEITIGNLTVTQDNGSENNLLVVESGTKIPVHSKVTPNNSSTGQVYWNSSDTSVCQVKDGFLEMKENRSAILTARTCNNLSAKFYVQGGIPISSLELPDTIDIELGKSSLVKCTVLPDGKHYGDIKFEISNESVAKFKTSRGEIEGVNLGNATLTATAGDGWGASDTCVVRVIPPHVTAISITSSKFPYGNSLNYSIGDARKPLQLKANVSPYNAIKDVIWTSSNENIATVDANGLVTLVGYGNVAIRATSVENNKIYDECKILLDYEVSLYFDGTRIHDARVFYQDVVQPKFEITYSPSSLPITDIEFSSSDDNVFRVEPDGTATWISEGDGYLICNYKISGVKKQEKYWIFCKPSRSSGIEYVRDDKDSYVKIYTIDGVLIFEGLYSEAILSPGYYILNKNGKTIKLQISYK